MNLNHTVIGSQQTNEIVLGGALNEASGISTHSLFIEETNSIKALLYWLNTHYDLETISTTDDIYTLINQSISSIDHLINDQLNIIIHNDKFQRLESVWRGLWYLSMQAEGCKNIKIKAFDITWSEISKDIERAIDFDQSQLYKKIYSEEYGTPGGEPYGVLIGDYEISHTLSKNQSNDDIATLEGLSAIAAAAFSPFICSASSDFFGIDDFSTLGSSINFEEVFLQKEYIKWQQLRKSSESQFIGLTVPRILMRQPYRKNPGSYKGLFFYEKDMLDNQSMYLWGNASYAFAGILVREFSNIGWFGHIRGVPRDHFGGGLVTNLTVNQFETDSDNIANKISTDVLITDTLERTLSSHGLIPLCHCYDTTFSAFYSNQSIQKIQTNSNNQEDQKLSTMLQHILCASRVAHYIKVMIRDKVGSFISAEECQIFLRKWLIKYTTGRHDLEWEQQARYPLREANVTVREHPDKSDKYLCVIHLIPHYQIDQIVSELELVTELEQSA